MADTRQISRLIHNRNIVLCSFEKLFNNITFLKYSSLSCLIRNRYTRASFTSDDNFTFSNLHLKTALCKENYLQCRYNLYIYTGFVNFFVRPGLLFDVSAAIFWRVNAETLKARARTMKTRTIRFSCGSMSVYMCEGQSTYSIYSVCTCTLYFKLTKVIIIDLFFGKIIKNF